MSKYQYITGSVEVLEKYNSPIGETGEYEGGGHFRFRLKEPFLFSDLGGRKLRFTDMELRIGDYIDSVPEFVGSHKVRLSVAPATKTVYRDLYNALSEAEKEGGALDGWCFSDDLEECI